MYYRGRQTGVWMIILYCNLATACASNPTNIQETDVQSTTAPATVAEASNDAATAYARSGDSEAELERSLQEFDAKILRELEQTQQQRQENARQKAAIRNDAELAAESAGEGEGESRQSASGEGNESSEKGNETAGSTGQQSSDTESDLSAAQETTTTAGQEETTDREGEGSRTTQTATIPTGDDDDVIARQLREAAEAETDPEVKEKLWEEYRKYKHQQSPGTTPTIP